MHPTDVRNAHAVSQDHFLETLYGPILDGKDLDAFREALVPVVLVDQPSLVHLQIDPLEVEGVPLVYAEPLMLQAFHDLVPRPLRRRIDRFDVFVTVLAQECWPFLFWHLGWEGHPIDAAVVPCRTALHVGGVEKFAFGVFRDATALPLPSPPPAPACVLVVRQGVEAAAKGAYLKGSVPLFAGQARP